MSEPKPLIYQYVKGLEENLARVEALHHPQAPDAHAWCDECGAFWPCATIRALAGPSPDEVGK